MRDLPGRPAEILLVEDDMGCCALMQRCLSDTAAKHRVSCVSDGVEALQFLKHQGSYGQAPRPDLVFLDLNMPRKNGWEVLAELKADSNLRRIPVIVMTSSSDQNDVNSIYDLHANCYLRKASDLDELCRQIRVIEEFWFGIVLRPNAVPVRSGR